MNTRKALEYMPGLLFEGRRLFLNPSKNPHLIFEAGVYSEGAFIQGNTVLTSLIIPVTSTPLEVNFCKASISPYVQACFI